MVEEEAVSVATEFSKDKAESSTENNDSFDSRGADEHREGRTRSILVLFMTAGEVVAISECCCCCKISLSEMAQYEYFRFGVVKVFRLRLAVVGEDGDDDNAGW